MLSVFCEHREKCSHWEVRGYAGLLPFVQFRALRVEFGADHLDRISSQQQPEGRVWGFDSLDDDLGAARRITLLVAVTGVVVVPALAVSDCCSERPAKSVLNAPGSTTMTLMPRGPTSLRSASDIPSRANFVAE